MRKTRALVGVFAALALVAGCGSQPASSAATNKKYDSLDKLVAAAEQEGSVILYTDYLQNDIDALQKAWQAKYPKIQLQVQRLGGTDGITRFESETEAGTPSADVISTAQLDYYPDAIKRGTIVSLRKSGALDFVPNYPKKYVMDDLGTALTQAVASGFSYNTAKVPADKVPTSWESLLDPYWKGKVLFYDRAHLDNTNFLVTLKRVADKYGQGFLTKLAAQMGAPQSDFVAMQGAVAAGEGGLIALTSLPFVVQGMQSKGAPVKFVDVPPAYWPVHGFAESAKPQHPAAAELLEEFMLTPEGAHAVNTGAGSYSPYDKIPDSFAPPTLKEINAAKAESDKLLAPFK